MSEFGGGIFGGGMQDFGADDFGTVDTTGMPSGGSTALTTGGAEPISSDAARQALNALLANVPAEDPTRDTTTFDVSSGTRRVRPAAYKPYTDRMVGTVVAQVQAPAGVPGVMYAFAPWGIVSQLPDNERRIWGPLNNVLNFETAAGNAFILPWYAIAQGAGYGFAMKPTEAVYKQFVGPNGVFFVAGEPAAPVVVAPKQAGMGLGTTVLLGAAVLGGAYAVTRMIQKKPIFPKMK